MFLNLREDMRFTSQMVLEIVHLNEYTHFAIDV